MLFIILFGYLKILFKKIKFKNLKDVGGLSSEMQMYVGGKGCLCQKTEKLRGTKLLQKLFKF